MRRTRPLLLRPLARLLSSRRRVFGIRSHDIIRIKIIKRRLIILESLRREFKSRGFSKGARITKRAIGSFMMEYLKIILAPKEINAPLPIIKRQHRTIESFTEEECKLYFRYKNFTLLHFIIIKILSRFNGKEQLRQIYECFQFRDNYKSTSRHNFSGHEVLLVGLYRLHRPNSQSDSFYRDQMGLKQEYTSMAVSLFLSHIIDNWSYLLSNHLDFWRPRFAALAEAGRNKFRALSGRTLPPASDEDGFKFVGFIDCSIFSTCRPGGGPTRPGVGAPRHSNNIQRAMYTGWKSVHGVKIQTVNLF